MSLTLEQLEEAGFPTETFPDGLPTPGESNIYDKKIDDDNALFRYQVNVDGATYGMEVLIDTSTVPDPAEGVSFMLNQFAFLWRQDPSQVKVKSDGSCRRIDF